MQSTNEISNRPGSSPSEQFGGVFAIAGAITLVMQHAPRNSGLFRHFNAHCIAGGKHLLPLGLGAGVPVLYCHEESETGRIATRRKLVSNRDPYDSTRERAAENIRDYCLQRKDRTDLSLLTREGQHALWSALDPATRVVVIDSLEGLTQKPRKDATGTAASVCMTELLERLMARGIAVVIFAKAQGRKKESPEWLDGLTCNMVYVEEDTKNPMQGGARLTIYRDAADELDRAPRRYAWWWKVGDDDMLDCSCSEEHFVEPAKPAPSARDVRREDIKALIADGITQQNAIAVRLGVKPSTINRGVLQEMIERGEVLKEPKTKKLSLPASDAPLAEGTNDSGNDDDAPDEEEDSSPVVPDKGTNEPAPAPKEDRDPEDEPW